MLGNRLNKRFKHLRKWAKRTNTSCFRLYEKDIPEFPLLIDWVDGDVVVWFKQRKRDETMEQQQAFRQLCLEEIKTGLNLNEEHIYIKERRRQKDQDGERQQYEKLDQSSKIKPVQEQGLTFEVNLSDYLDIGLFLDHRPARGWIRDKAHSKMVLNLFAYTGSFSVYAKAGAAKSVTTVDMSKTYLSWAQRNCELNGTSMNTNLEFIAADCLSWLTSAVAQNLKYDLIICDPPTFSNSKRMNESSFSVDRDHLKLLTDISKLMTETSELFFSNNSRAFEMNPAVSDFFEIKEVSHLSIPEDFRNRQIHRSWWLKRIKQKM